MRQAVYLRLRPAREAFRELSPLRTLTHLVIDDFSSTAALSHCSLLHEKESRLSRIRQAHTPREQYYYSKVTPFIGALQSLCHTTRRKLYLVPCRMVIPYYNTYYRLPEVAVLVGIFTLHESITTNYFRKHGAGLPIH